MTKPFAFLAVLVLAGSPATLYAQPRPSVEEQNANETRERVRQILEQYPPSLRQVLRCDPSLLNRPEYLTTYPTLAAYVTQHPEIAHNPVFFLSGGCGGGGGSMEGRSQVAISLENIFVGLEVMLGVMFGIGTIGWILRSGIDYRRWQRAMKIQTEAHTKIVDRLASNDDLITYMNSAAGQRFLMAAPMAPSPIDTPAMPVAAPINRILWSVQAGVILAVAGAGLFIAKSGIIDEAAQAMQVLAILVMALGFGFVLSALASWALSRQFGLVQSRTDHA
jgi:hypothetical protein